MKCFNHPENDAIGICKACGRGLCRYCVVEVGLSCSCKGECERVVATMNDLLEKSRTRLQKFGGIYSRIGLVAGLLGFLVLSLAGFFFADSNLELGLTFAILSVPFLLLGGMMAYFAKRVGKL